MVAVHRHVTGEDNSGLASLVAEASGEVAVSIAGILTGISNVRVGGLGVALEGIHDGTLQVAERRGLISQGVVIAAISRAGGALLVADETVGRREGGHIAEIAERAVIRRDGAKAAGIQGTVGTRDVHLSFTAEEAVILAGGILAGGAVIRIEAGFEDEANLRVADVFRTLQTPAGAGGHTGIHGERVGGTGSVIQILVGVDKTRINAAVQRDGRFSKSRSRESAEKGESK